MPTVYRVLRDARYQRLEPVNKDDFLNASKNGWAFDGTSHADDWEPLEMFVREPMLDRPDVWQIAGSFAFEDHAADIVQLCLDQTSEQFKLPFEDRILIVPNVTYVIDCLDKHQSDYDEELPHMISEYSFHEDRLDFSLFKIPETRMSELLTVEGVSSPDEEFKPLIEKHGLKGLQFQEIWTSG